MSVVVGVGLSSPIVEHYVKLLGEGGEGEVAVCLQALSDGVERDGASNSKVELGDVVIGNLLPVLDQQPPAGRR